MIELPKKEGCNNLCPGFGTDQHSLVTSSLYLLFAFKNENCPYRPTRIRGYCILGGHPKKELLHAKHV